MSITQYKAPTYLLADVQARVKAEGRKCLSKSAIDCGQGELGMTTQEIIDFVVNHPDTGFYKTMPAREVPGAMQDVYWWECPNGMMAYVKVSLHPGSYVVISFKEK